MAPDPGTASFAALQAVALQQAFALQLTLLQILLSLRAPSSASSVTRASPPPTSANAAPAAVVISIFDALFPQNLDGKPDVTEDLNADCKMHDPGHISDCTPPSVNNCASVTAPIMDPLQDLLTAKNNEMMAWFDHFTQETVTTLDASIAAHSSYIADDKRWKHELVARIDAMDLLMNKCIPPEVRTDHRLDEFDGKTEMHAPVVPNSEYAIQFTNNFIDLRADLDFLPREQHGPQGVLALLDRLPTGDAAVLEPPHDCDEDSPWENYLNSLQPDVCHQVLQEMHSQNVFYDEPLDEPLASYDHLLSTWPGAHAAVAAPSSGM